MEQKVDNKGQENKPKADNRGRENVPKAEKGEKRVVATRTVDKLLEQSKLSAPGSVKSQGEEKKSVARLNKVGSVGRWFQILCFTHIPFFGFLYMLVKALWRKTPQEERHFAIAYLLYRILILFLALAILYVLYKVGLQFVDGILDYAGMGS